jgi:CHAT domain-containing protein/predicted negative regulator of RcsB-dependent stress response
VGCEIKQRQNRSRNSLKLLISPPFLTASLTLLLSFNLFNCCHSLAAASNWLQGANPERVSLHHFNAWGTLTQEVSNDEVFLYRRTSSSENKSDSAVESKTATKNKNSEAEAAVMQGEALRAAWTEESLREAIKKFAEALSRSRAIADHQEESRALNLIGDVHLILSEYQKALASYYEAFKVSHSAGQRQAEIRALNNISSVYIYLGKGAEALSYCKRAYRLSREAGDYQGRAWSLNNMGEVYYFSGDMREAQDSFDQALSLWHDDDWRGKAQTLLNIGYLQFDIRNMDKALEHYNRALSTYRAASDRRGEALALTAIGGAYSYLGRKQAALNNHYQAVNLFRQIGDRNGEAVALNGLGYVYRNLADYQKALDCYSQARQLFSILGNREYENFTLIRVGNSYQGLGDNRRALECYQLSLRRTVKYSQTRANALNFIGMVYDSMKEPQKALGYYAKALELYRTVEDRMGEASILNNIGGVYNSTGEKSTALDYYGQALAHNRAVQDRGGEAATLYNIARLRRDLNDLAEARSQIEAALRIIESLRAQVLSRDLRVSYSAAAYQYYELYIDLLMQINKREPASNLDALALQISEQARARSLLDMLVDVRDNIRQRDNSALLDREYSLNVALNGLFERRAKLLNGKHAEEQVTSLDKEIQTLTAEYNDVETQVRSQKPSYAALLRPSSISLQEIQQQVLEDNTLLLEYSLGDERSYLWAVTKDGMTSYELPGRKEIEDAAREVYELLTARRHRSGEAASSYSARVAQADAEYWQKAAYLSSLLISPVADQLKDRRLLVIADGALQYIPFGALPAPVSHDHSSSPAAVNLNADIATPLIVTREIVNLPSASIQAVLRNSTAQRRSAQRSVAVLADPVFEKDDQRLLKVGTGADANTTTQQIRQELPAGTGGELSIANGGRNFSRLPASRDEAEAIMSVTSPGTGLKALGFAANRDTALNPTMANYRIVHFATHGVLDSEHPELSCLVLSLFDEQGRDQDGLLRLSDIYNLNLPVEMVVLSGCDTGLGKDIKGEGLVGLTRGFMYAGASSVVASLWTVDDDATAELMRIFYKRMLVDGVPRATALREAQIEMYRQKRWRAPYYWAAFILQGDYHSAISESPWKSVDQRVVGIMVSVLLLGGFYVARRYWVRSWRV